MISKQLKAQLKKISQYQAYIDFQKSVVIENSKWFHDQVQKIVDSIHKLNVKSPFLPEDEKKLKKLFQQLNYFEGKAHMEQKISDATLAKETAFKRVKNSFRIALDEQVFQTKKKLKDI